MSTPAAPSIVRTLVPVAVGQIVAYFATIGLTIPEDVETSLTVILGFAVTTVYYLAVRFLEQKFPKLGVLLGWAAVPAAYMSPKEREVADAIVIDNDEGPDDYEPRH